ncbi:GPI mannosyltransferase 1 [Glossina fuscipes]|uniref:GPI alpha-1,4-mannosyltransferase I, catalytic subunit n=1 Tax=Glossina fuscipes TaxID=7396 RepID=A0A9C5YSC4_9MUSC|nr:GPI mannosyltransferase 1 [Glossina fuscipes]
MLHSLHSLINIRFFAHLYFSTIIRLLLIVYGEIHDSYSEVPYTDIDYKVVVDGARGILNDGSPFNRHTFRYSPIYAFMQIPSVLLHPAVGKIIYSGFDIWVAVLIYKLVKDELRFQYSRLKKTDCLQSVNIKCPEIVAKVSACFWLYNPLTAVISTRGNGDSFSSFIVILTLYMIMKAFKVNEQRLSLLLIFYAGILHGLAIHLRLYPLFFSLAYYLALSEHSTCRIADFIRKLICPCKKQLLLIMGTVTSLTTLTLLFYKLYGFKFLYEAYIYHLVRKDLRHNFSLYFLMQYLGSDTEGLSSLQKLLVLMPQLIMIVFLTFAFGQFRQSLPFCIFTITFVMVTYNSVVTSQYFIWYLALLPLCFSNFKSIGIGTAVSYFSLWVLAQGLWLLPAFLLEFQGWNTFYWLWLQSIVFFIVNNFLLIQLIKNFDFITYKH